MLLVLKGYYNLQAIGRPKSQVNSFLNNSKDVQYSSYTTKNVEQLGVEDGEGLRLFNFNIL